MTDSILNTPTISEQVQIKMTSLDIADMTGKLHKNVMADIRQEIESIGEIDGLIFQLVKYVDRKGEKRPCYEFGKTGAMQISLRYDAKTRYKVVKKIEELESIDHPETIQTPSTPMQGKVSDLKSFIEMAEIFGLNGNQKLLSANTAMKKTQNFDCMDCLGITHLVSEDQTQYFTPTVLGKPQGISAVKFNRAMESAGLQAARRDHTNKIVWEVTDLGRKYSQLLDTNKRYSNGTPILQIKWSKDVLGLLGEQV